MIGRWRALIVAVLHVVAVFLLHFVESNFLFVGEERANFSRGGLVNLAHLRPGILALAGGVIHCFDHLVVLVLEDGSDLRLLGIG